MPTMELVPIHTRVFNERDDLFAFIFEHIPALPERSVLAVTSKIVALSEGRTGDVRELPRLIAEESEWQQETKLGSLTLKDGLYMWNAGIDGSNAAGKVVLLPKDSFAAANALRDRLREHYAVRDLGIVVTDSRVMPLRAGVVGVALGYAGFRGSRDYRGTADIFGKPLAYTQTNVADSLATAAALIMGEGAEQQPLCLMSNAPVEFVDTIETGELIIPPEEDMYGPLFGTR